MEKEKKEMTINEVIEGLKQHAPLNITAKVDLRGKKVGLVVIDLIKGFCKVGAGKLAPPAPDEIIKKVVEETRDAVNKVLDADGLVLFINDCHTSLENPYPEHARKGSGEEELMDELAGFEFHEGVTILEKNCVNAFIANTWKILQLIENNEIEALVVRGDCTDICIMEFVLTLMSIRNNNSCSLQSLKEVVVDVNGVFTYNLPREVAESIGLPAFAAHPREITHYMGLYLMGKAGAVLAQEVIF